MQGGTTGGILKEDQKKIRVYASYVPKCVLKHFQLKPVPLKAPYIEVKQAAVLFADISGFTPLSEKLSKLGAEGIELLTKHLNNFFDKLIQKIHLYGGDIIKFAGDALMAVWADDVVTTKLPRLVNLSCQCALDIQQNLHNFNVEDCVLRLHIGLGAGKLGFVHVGGENNRLEFLVTGDPLEQVAECERAASPGEVYISQQAALLLQDDLKYGKKKEFRRKKFATYADKKVILLSEVKTPEAPKPADYLPTTFSTDLRPVLSPYIPLAVTSRLNEDTFQSLRKNPINQVRLISVIFVNIDLMYIRGVKPLLKLQEAVRSMQRDLFHYEGTLRQFLVDDKGSVMIGVFGTPPVTHEDDPSRAVMAAIRIQRNLLEVVQVQSRIGVTTGQSFIGDVGNKERREYAMVGDIVNLSARLMSLCPWGQIRCDSETQKACIGSASRKIEFEKLAPEKVKGKEHPIDIYRPITEENAATFKLQNRTKFHSSSQLTLGMKQPIIGRTEELQDLEEYLSASIDKGEHKIVIFSGEAGIGKTRILQEFRWRLLFQRLEVTVVWGQADSIETTPYNIWREILWDIFDLQPYLLPKTGRLDSVANDVKEHITKWIEKEIPDLQQFLPTLSAIIPLDWPDNDVTSKLTPQERTSILQDIVVRVINHSCNVMVLYNAHWMDPQSWSMTLVVAERCKRLFLLLSMRPMVNPLPVELVQIQRMEGTTHTIKLKGLNSTELIEIVKRRLNIKVLPQKFEEDLTAKMDQFPNPLFAEETADQLLKMGLVQINPETGKGTVQPNTQILSTNIPSSLRGVFIAKVDRLTQSQQLVLRYSAIIGKSFRISTLLYVLPISGTDLILANQSNESSQLIGDLLERSRVLTEKKSFLKRSKSEHIPMGKVSDELHHTIKKKEKQEETDTPVVVKDPNDIIFVVEEPNKLVVDPPVTKLELVGVPSISLSQGPSEPSIDMIKKKRRASQSTTIDLAKTKSHSEVPQLHALSKDSWTDKKGGRKEMFSAREKVKQQRKSDGGIILEDISDNEAFIPGTSLPTTFTSGTVLPPTDERTENSTPSPIPSVSSISPLEIPNLKLNPHHHAHKHKSAGRRPKRAEENRHFSRSLSDFKQSGDHNLSSIYTSDRKKHHRHSSRSPLTSAGEGTSISGPPSVGENELPQINITSEVINEQKPTYEQLFKEVMQLKSEMKILIQQNAAYQEENEQLRKLVEKFSLRSSDDTNDRDKSNATMKKAKSSTSVFRTPFTSGLSFSTSRTLLPESPQMLDRMESDPNVNAIDLGDEKKKNSISDTVFKRVHKVVNKKPPRSPSKEEYRDDYSLSDISHQPIFLTQGSNPPETGPSPRKRSGGGLSLKTVSTSQILLPSSVVDFDKERKFRTPSDDLSDLSRRSEHESLYRSKSKSDKTRSEFLEEGPYTEALISEIEEFSSKKKRLSQISLKKKKENTKPVNVVSVSTSNDCLEEESEERRSFDNSHNEKRKTESKLQLLLILEELREACCLEPLSLIELDNFSNTEEYLFKFKYSILRDVLYKTILPSQRKETHEKIAAWYEQDNKIPLSEVASQWKKAEFPQKAVYYYSKAGEGASVEFDHRKAIKYFSKVLALSEKYKATLHPSLSELGKTNRQLAENYYSIGDMDNSQKCVNVAFTCLREVDPQYAVQDWEVVFPQLNQFNLEDYMVGNNVFGSNKDSKQKKWQKTKSAARMSKSKFLNLANLNEIIKSLLCLAQVFYFQCKNKLFTYCTLHALSMAESTGQPTPCLKKSLSMSILTASMNGLASTQCGHDYMSMGNLLFKDEWIKSSSMYVGLFFSAAGKWTQAAEMFSTSRELANLNQDNRTFEESTLYLTFNYLIQGNINTSLELAEIVFKSARARGDLQLQVLGLIVQAHCCYISAKYEEFTKRLKDIDSYCTEELAYKMDTVSRLHWHSLKILAEIHRDDTEKALSEIALLDKLSKQSQPTVYFSFLANFYSLLVKIFVLQKSDNWINKQLKQSQALFLHNIISTFKEFEEIAKIFPVVLPFSSFLKTMIEQITKQKIFDPTTFYPKEPSTKFVSIQQSLLSQSDKEPVKTKLQLFFLLFSAEQPRE